MNVKLFPVAVTALVMLSAFAGACMQNAFAYNHASGNATHSIAIIPNPNQITHVNIVVEETKRMIESKSEDVTLLDVRTADEYHTAHIEDATLIPVAELSNRTEELNKSKKIIVYCRSGKRSVIASGILIEHGFDRVYNVLGGINAWEESGYAVVPSTTPEQPGFESVLAIAGLLAVACWIRCKKVSFK